MHAQKCQVELLPRWNTWLTTPGTPVSCTRKLISSSFHHLDMTLPVAEALNPNKPNQSICRFPQLYTPPCWAPWWVGSGDGETKYTNMNNPNPNKKRPLSIDSDSDQNVDETRTVSASDDWPRFIILEPTENDRPLARLSTFAIHKGIMGIAGTVKECGKKAHADNLLCATTLAGVGMKASPHRSLNSSKGELS